MSNDTSIERVALLKQLTHLFSESGCSEFEFEGAGFSLKLKREMASSPEAGPSRATITGNSRSPTKEPSPPTSEVPASTGKRRTVLSGITGLFFRASAPGKSPFVSVGDKVSSGQTLCLVEAMKMLNAIESEIEGTVVEVLLEDGAEVSAGTPLFVIEVADV